MSNDVNVNEPEIVSDFEDGVLLEMGQEDIKPLLAKDWDSQEDDIWDTI
jgi:hypothetical protein